MIPLLDHDLDVRVLSCERLEVVEEEGACVGGGGPLVAVLENEFSDLGDEGYMSVCRRGPQLSSEQRRKWTHVFEDEDVKASVEKESEAELEMSCRGLN